MNCMDFRIVIQAMIKSFGQSPYKRTEDNSNDMFGYYLYNTVNKILQRWIQTWQKKTLNKTGSSNQQSLILPLKGKKKGKKEEEEVRVFQHRLFTLILVTSPSRNPAKQGLTLLSRWDMGCCPCGVMTLCWITIFILKISQKLPKKEKKYRKNKNESENLIILSLLTGQDAVPSL